MKSFKVNWYLNLNLIEESKFWSAIFYLNSGSWAPLKMMLITGRRGYLLAVKSALFVIPQNVVGLLCKNIYKKPYLPS